MKVLIFIAKWTGTILLVIALIIFWMVIESAQREHDAMCSWYDRKMGYACYEWNERSTWWNPKGL